MSAPALLHVYRYAAASTLERAGGAASLTLATSGGAEPNPFFFEGRLRAPRRAADALLTVARVARSRFFVPPSMLAKVLAAADPVVTCHASGVRFESFSACAGVYARFDLHREGIEATDLGSGTTNVDFHPDMRALLARVTRTENLRLSVGRSAVKMVSEAAEALERKVPLPLRWLRSFGEVQAVLSRMTPVLRITGAEARRFFRGLPKTSPRGTLWLVRTGGSLRISHAAAQGALAVGGLGRLSALDGALDDAVEVMGWGEGGGASAWEVVYPDGRFTLALSPETWRGFSGEGGLLQDLAASDAGGAPVAEVRATLAWQPIIDAGDLVRTLGRDRASVDAALAVLASRGLVGFDLAAGAYFHRALPFALEQVEAMHPRLVDAKRLLDEGAITLHASTSSGTAGSVRARDGGSHDVRIDAEDARCSCPWYGKHGTARGPCKHVLAVQIARDRADEEGTVT